MNKKTTIENGPVAENEPAGHRSISTQLTVFLIIAIGAISIAVIAVMHLYRVQTARHELEAKADEIFAYLDGILQKSLWDLDEKNIQVVGETTSQNELVAKLIIKDSFGQMIYQKVLDSEPETINRSGKVFYEGVQVGYVEVGLTQKFYNQTSRQLLSASLITLVVALVILIVTTGFLIRRFLKSPLDSLNNILDAYALGIYDPQRIKIPYLEFQPFGRVLAQMGKKITRQLQEVRQAEEKYRNIFENAVEGIFQSSVDGRFLSVSPSMAKIFGYASPGDLISEVSDIGAQCYLNPEDCDEFTRCINKEGLVKRLEIQMVRRDKSHFWVSISARLVRDDDGRPLYYEGFCVDITRQKNLETQLRQAQKMEAIGTLAGGIAHDFNNILGVIIGCTELSLGKVPQAGEEALLLGKVLRSGRRAKDLVKQILTFSRQDQSEIKPLYLSSIVKETLKFIRVITPATIQIKPEINENSGAVMADPIQIHRLLMNLYTNAIHAMKAKGGVLKVTLADRDFSDEIVAVQTDIKSDLQVELCVRDTGHGMTPDTVERIFDPFYTTKPVGEGTGLGLSVVHGIVKKHNGAIMVDSKPAEGTAFRIYFPRLDKRHIKIMEELEIGVPRGNERILLVDDEQELVDTLVQVLQDLGYVITATTDSPQAYDLFRNAPEDFDLVITDLTMPAMTGIDLAEKIIQINPDFPIIMCTGFSELIAPQQARAFGVREVLFKPVARRQLATAIRKVLDHRMLPDKEGVLMNTCDRM